MNFGCIGTLIRPGRLRFAACSSWGTFPRVRLRLPISTRRGSVRGFDSRMGLDREGRTALRAQ